MGDLRRRDVLTAGSLLLTGSLAGCAGLVDGAEQLPAEIPLYGQNDRDDRVSLAYWVSTTASTPDGVALDGVAQLEAGEARKLTRIPVEAPSDGTNSTPTGTSEREDGYPNRRSSGSVIDITADLLHRDDQRNVLLQINPDSEAFSETGYVITVRGTVTGDVGTPGRPVAHESVPGDETVVADYIRISPRSEKGSTRASK
jgi:hypothetical protein